MSNTAPKAPLRLNLGRARSPAADAFLDRIEGGEGKADASAAIAAAPTPEHVSAPIAPPSAPTAQSSAKKKAPAEVPPPVLAGDWLRVRVQLPDEELPWVVLGDRAEAQTSMNLRLTEGDLAKLRFIADHIPRMSVQRFCREAIRMAINAEIAHILGRRVKK